MHSNLQLRMRENGIRQPIGTDERVSRIDRVQTASQRRALRAFNDAQVKRAEEDRRRVLALLDRYASVNERELFDRLRLAFRAGGGDGGGGWDGDDTQPTPSLMDCPRNPEHLARALAGGEWAWCPSCRKIVSVHDDEEEKPTYAPLYVGVGLLAFWVAVIGWALS